jgi:hypothetical protein
MDLFAEAIQEYGNRFPTALIQTPGISAVFSKFNAHAAHHIEFLRKTYPRLPPIHFGFTDNPTVNAGARRWRDEYVIFINGGVVAVLSLFFTRIMSDPAILTDIGDASVERTALPKLDFLLPNAESMMEQFHRLVVPRDQQRLDYSDGLLHRALRFLFSHELTHILNGHVDLLGKSGVHSLVEASSEGPGGHTLDRDAMEMDADFGAIMESMYTCLQRIAPKREQDPDVSNQTFHNPWQGFVVSFFAVYALFRLFGDKSRNKRTYYFTPRLRQIFVSITACRYIKEISIRPDLEETCQKSSKWTLCQVEEAYSLVLREPWSVAGLNDAAKSSPTHSKRLNSHWRDSLRARLTPYAYVRLP